MGKSAPTRTLTKDAGQSTTQPPPESAIAEPVSDVEAHLTKLGAQLELLRAQVRQAQQLASMGTAAAMIAHEVRNLLTPIRAYAQRALDEDDGELQRKALQVTLRSAAVLVGMCERILEVSAAKPPARKPVSIHGAAHDAAESLCRDLAKDGIRFTVKVDESLTAWADPLQLQQVFFNLFLNARKAMASSHNGRLTVTASREENIVRIEVKDTGNGIPAAVLPHAFDPFQTSKPTNGSGPRLCAGLGLALCRDLVEESC